MYDLAIVGVDSGVTTGYAVFFYNKQNFDPHKPEKWFTSQLSYGGSGNAKDLVTGDQAFIEQKICGMLAEVIRKASTKAETTCIAIEDFIIRRTDTSRDFLSPVRITAGLLQEIYETQPKIFFQQPANAKTTCTDERMDKWGFTIKTRKDRHGRDAARHCILLARRIKENPRIIPPASCKEQT